MPNDPETSLKAVSDDEFIFYKNFANFDKTPKRRSKKIKKDVQKRIKPDKMAIFLYFRYISLLFNFIFNKVLFLGNKN